jgi:phenylacetate-CoA ligase
MPGMAWPSILDPEGSQILAVLYQLEESQYMHPDKLLEKQFQQLNEVYSHSVKTVPYYKKTFYAAGFRKYKKITPNLWHKLPILSRSVVQLKQKDLLSKNIPRNHGRTNVLQTSGSTGLPVKVVGTDLIQLFYRIFALRDHFWHKRDFSAKMAAIRHANRGQSEYPGTSSPTWSSATAGLLSTGPLVMLNSSTDISLQAEFLQREQPDYLISYPSNLEALARYFLKEKLQIRKLRGVRALGEALGSEVRTVCHEAWDVPLVDLYSAQEVGYIALQCPENGNNYHIQSENLFVEVVDDEGKPCKPGVIGRVLLTTLHNFAMPLIRYEIGDYAEVGELCPCGRTLPVLSQIMGRRRNMLLLPDGRTSWPSFGMSKWEKNLPIKQFQFVQKSLDHIEARLVTDRQFTKEEESHFKSILQENFRHPFNINIIYLEAIPRSKGGKFDDFISEVA